MYSADRYQIPTRPSYSVVDLLGSKKPRKVLFVSGKQVISRSFVRTMNKKSIEIDVMQSSKEALDCLQDNDFAAVLATDDIDSLDGIGFLAKAKKVRSDANRILISGKTDLESTVAAINVVGLFSFITLPWEPAELIKMVNRACEHYALKHENKKLGNLLGDKVEELANLATHLEKNVQNRTTSLLIGLNAALDLRDNETQGHSRRVALYAKRLAEQMGFSKEKVLVIERGSLLHDIGKIGVSDSILLKPAKLTDEEWVEMRKHSEHGYKILQNVEFLGDARLIVWQHHERWDGKGYPQKLKGTDVFIGARIFSVIDTYDAITSDRPYRKGRSYEDATEEIVRWSNIQFDSTVVDAWLSIPKAEILSIRDAAKDANAGID